MKKAMIVGGGEIGSFIAERLAAEHIAVTVMDENPDALSAMRTTLDVAAVQGNGANLADLVAAGAEDMDLFIAATNWDETNLIICLLAQELKIPNKIAITRMISAQASRHDAGFDYARLGIDLIVNINEALRDEMLDVLESPGVSEIASFADGRITLIGHQVDKKSKFLGHTVQDMTGGSGESYFYVAAVVRDRALEDVSPDLLLAEGDYLYLLTTAEFLPILKTLLQVETLRSRTAVIYGDNRLAQLLAAALLNRHFQVTMLAETEEKAAQIRESFKLRRHLLVEAGEGTEVRLLRRVKVGTTSVFVATTPDDATNLTACMTAKYLGAGKTIANIRRNDILPLIQRVGVDVAVAPRLAATKVIQKSVHGDTLLDYRAVSQINLEVVELEAAKGCKMVKQPLHQIKLPPGVIIGGVVSNGESSLPTPDMQIQAGDKVIVLTLPEMLMDVESMFAK